MICSSLFGSRSPHNGMLEESAYRRFCVQFSRFSPPWNNLIISGVTAQFMFSFVIRVVVFFSLCRHTCRTTVIALSFADLYFRLRTELTSDMAVANNVSIGTEGLLRFSPPYSVDEYVHGCLLRLYACWFDILTASSKQAVVAGHHSRDTNMEADCVVGNTAG